MDWRRPATGPTSAGPQILLGNWNAGSSIETFPVENLPPPTYLENTDMHVLSRKELVFAGTTLLVCASLFSWKLRSAADSLPRLRVESVRRVFHNGEHNAFTDLIRSGVFPLRAPRLRS